MLTTRSLLAATLLLPALVSLGVPATGPAQEPGGEGMERRIEEVVSSEILDGGATSVALWVDLGGDTLLENGWGAPLSDGAEEFGPHTAIPANGLVEVLLGAGLLSQIDAGELEPSTSVEHLLEAIEREGESPTLGQIASHTSGLPAYVPETVAEDPQAAFLAFLAFLGSTGLEFEPGSCFEPSGTNTLAQAAYLRATGAQNLVGWLQSEVLASIGLDETQVLSVDELDGRPSDARITILGKPMQPDLDLTALGLGGIESTTADAGQLLRALHAGGWLGTQANRAITGPEALADGSDSPYAFGMWRTTLEAAPGFGVTGTCGDWTLHVAHYPGYDLTVALAFDSNEVSAANVERGIARVVLDRPGPTIEDRPVLEDEFERYTGTYQVGCNTYEIGADDGRLVVRSEDYPGDRMLYQGGNLFVLESDWEVRLLFEVEEGLATGFVLDVHGVSSVATRIDRG